MPKFLSNSSPTTRTEQSLGPNLQSRLEALEAAMGVRLNVAKRQGRHSLSNTASSSPMQISPTSTSSVTISTTNSSRHPVTTTISSSRLGQGVQRSASSCDTENRPGPIKRLKPSLPIENSNTTTTVHPIATVKQYHPTVRRPLTSTQSTPTTTITPITTTAAGTRPLISKTSVPSKIRSTPVHTTSNRTINSPKTLTRSTTKSKPVLVSPPPPARSATYPRKKNQSIFGEKFSDDILKTNLLWIDLKDLDDDARTEILIQFGSIDKFLHEQRLFVANQQQQQQQQHHHHHHHQHQHVKLTADNKIGTNRSRLQLLIPKKDRLELL